MENVAKYGGAGGGWKKATHLIKPTHTTKATHTHTHKHTVRERQKPLSASPTCRSPADNVVRNQRR